MEENKKYLPKNKTSVEWNTPLNEIKINFNFEKFKLEREKRNWNKVHICKSIGVSDSSLTRLENGTTRNMDIESYYKLCLLFNCSFEFFLTIK